MTAVVTAPGLVCLLCGARASGYVTRVDTWGNNDPIGVCDDHRVSVRRCAGETHLRRVAPYRAGPRA